VPVADSQRKREQNPRPGRPEDEPQGNGLDRGSFRSCFSTTSRTWKGISSRGDRVTLRSGQDGSRPRPAGDGVLDLPIGVLQMLRASRRCPAAAQRGPRRARKQAIRALDRRRPSGASRRETLPWSTLSNPRRRSTSTRMRRGSLARSSSEPSIAERTPRCEAETRPQRRRRARGSTRSRATEASEVNQSWRLLPTTALATPGKASLW
jgi:hypothetical protein